MRMGEELVQVGLFGHVVGGLLEGVHWLTVVERGELGV